MKLLTRKPRFFEPKKNGGDFFFILCVSAIIFKTKRWLEFSCLQIPVEEVVELRRKKRDSSIEDGKPVCRRNFARFVGSCSKVWSCVETEEEVFNIVKEEEGRWIVYVVRSLLCYILQWSMCFSDPESYFMSYAAFSISNYQRDMKSKIPDI